MSGPGDLKLTDYLSEDELESLLQRAKAEDLGAKDIDVTSLECIPAALSHDAALVARQPGRLSGGAVISRLAGIYDERINVHLHLHDGKPFTGGQTLATLSGPLRSILTLERVALNFLTHLSGIATLTANFVEQIAHTRARIYDTRKTLPGLRHIEKYAVACGGGHSHRMGLYDAMLIKDNHISHIEPEQLAGTLRDAIQRAKRTWRELKFVEVEVDRLDQLDMLWDLDINVILLDNMPVDQIRQAVAMRDRIAGLIELEASGGINPANIRSIAETGVDRIAIGAITHSAPAVDIGLDLP